MSLNLCTPCSSTFVLSSFFFFNDTATTEIYTLSLHDALPISDETEGRVGQPRRVHLEKPAHHGDRKSTRLNSSHLVISYAVFCLKTKKKKSCRHHGLYKQQIHERAC